MNTLIKINRYLWAVAVMLLLPELLLGADTFTRFRTDKESLQWGEECRITLGVYSRTWFTDGVSFPDMRGQNGVLLKKDRSYTSSEIIGGERYSVVSQEYLYYPFGTGAQALEFDAIEVYTPPVGEFKGVRQILNFPKRTITVSATQAQHLRLTAATRLKAKQSFELPDTLRVGDIVSRSVEYIAEGVPAAFVVLPEIKDTLGYARIIGEHPSYLTELHNGKVVGRVTQRILYQMTDAGQFAIPTIHIKYHSPKSNQLRSVTLDGKTIHVLPSYAEPTRQEISSNEQKQTKWLKYIGIITLLTAVSLYILRLIKYLRKSSYWRIITASDYPQLYDALYEYASSAHYNNFQELSRQDPEASALYGKLQQRLFEDGCTNKGGWCIKFKLLYLVILRLKRH